MKKPQPPKAGVVSKISTKLLPIGPVPRKPGSMLIDKKYKKRP
jgi:hypothetical protein